MSIDEIVRQAQALPLDERIVIVDRLLQSLGSCDESIEREWFELAARRAEEIATGEIESVSGEHVLEKLRRRIRG